MAVRSDKNFVRSSSYYLGSSFCPQRPKARCFILQHVVLLSSQDTFYASLLGMSLDYDYTEGYESPVYEDISPDELSSDDSGQRDLGQRDPDTPFSTVATPGQLESDDSFSDYGSNETVTDSYDSDENSTTDFDNGWQKATLLGTRRGACPSHFGGRTRGGGYLTLRALLERKTAFKAWATYRERVSSKLYVLTVFIYCLIILIKVFLTYNVEFYLILLFALFQLSSLSSQLRPGRNWVLFIGKRE